MAGRAIDEDDLGAWVIKCDPRRHPHLRRAVLQHEPHVVEHWCVAENYRSRMMRAGVEAILWVSGDGGTVPRGIWGVGWITGAADGEVPLHIPLLREGLTDAELRAAGIDDLEVQKLAIGSNPSWVSTAQLERIRQLLDGWPARVE